MILLLVTIVFTIQVYAATTVYATAYLVGDHRSETDSFTVRITQGHSNAQRLLRTRRVVGAAGSFDGISTFDHVNGRMYHSNDEEDAYIWPIDVKNKTLLSPILANNVNNGAVAVLVYDNVKERVLAFFLNTAQTYAQLISIPDPISGGNVKRLAAETLQSFDVGDPRFQWQLIFDAAVDAKNQILYVVAADAAHNNVYYLTSIDISKVNGAVTQTPISCASGPAAKIYAQRVAFDTNSGNVLVAAAGNPGTLPLYQVWTVDVSTGACSAIDFVLPAGNDMIVDCWAFDQVSRQFFLAVPNGFQNPLGSYVQSVHVDTGAISIFANLTGYVFPNSLEVWNQ